MNDPTVTIGGIIDEYLTNRARHILPRTLKRKRGILKRLAREFGHLHPESLRPSLYENWLYAQEVWTSNATRWCVSNWIQAFFNWAVREGVITRNPIATVKVESGEPRRATTDAEFRAMLRACAGRTGTTKRSGAELRRVLLFLRNTGCRPCEAVRARWEWLKWTDDTPVLFIPKDQHKTGRKTKAPRRVYMLPTAQRLLLWLRRQGGSSGPIFMNSRGKPWKHSTIGKRLEHVRHRSGLPMDATFHGLRHLFACEWIAKGGSVKLLSEWLGHSSTVTVEKTYIHGQQISEQVLAEGISVMARPLPVAVGGKS